MNGLLSKKVDDEDITPLDKHDTPQVAIQWPITRVRARQLKIPVSSFLGTPFCDYKRKLLPNDIIIFSNFGVDQEVLRERHGGGEDQRGRPSLVEGPIHISSSPPQILGADCTKIITQITYRLHFRCCTYA